MPEGTEETLRKDVRDYVKAGGWDAFSFSMLASPKYDRVAGRKIQAEIDKAKAWMIDDEREALE